MYFSFYFFFILYIFVNLYSKVCTFCLVNKLIILFCLSNSPSVFSIFIIILSRSIGYINSLILGLLRAFFIYFRTFFDAVAVNQSLVEFFNMFICLIILIYSVLNLYIICV